MLCRSRSTRMGVTPLVSILPMCLTLVSFLATTSEIWSSLAAGSQQAYLAVKPNTALDREARKRGISVYLVQRAVPMLPPQLSEELSSLQPGVDRLTFSAIFELDKEGNVVSKRFGRTIIK